MKPECMTKTSVQDLALFGGKPLFAEPLHVGRPNRPGKAVFMQHANDIPALKVLAEKTDNEDIRTAVSDAIEALQE